jgi:CRP-like cAMP-binding protein
VSDRGARSGTFRSALENRDIRLALIGQAIGSASQYLISTALAIYLVSSLGPGSLGLLALRYVPAAVLGPAASIPTNRLGPRTALVALCTARALVIGAAMVALATGVAPAVVVAISVLDAAFATACVPAVAIVQVSVARSPSELAAASAMTSNTKSVFEVLGGLIAGFATAIFSSAAVFGLAAVVTFIGGLTALGLSVRGVQRGVRKRGAPEWRLILDRRITPLTAMVMLRASNRAVWVGLAVLAATGFLGMGTAGVGTLVTAAGVGSVISIPTGVALIGRRRLGAMAAIAVVGMGVALILVAASASVPVALVVIAAWGLFGAVSDMSIGALIPRASRGRVGSVVSMNETIKNWMQAGGTALVPVSVAVLGTRSAVALWGALPVVGVLLAKRALDRVDVDVVEHIRVVERVRSIPLFQPLRVVELEQIVAALERQSVAAGQVVVRENDPVAQSLFIIDGGAVAVTVRGDRVRDLAPGDHFGEIALLHSVPRTATVTATVDTVLLELDRDAFIQALTGYQAGQEALTLSRPVSDRPVSLLDALEATPLLRGLDERGRRRLAELTSVSDRPAGSVMCTEGDASDSVFLLLEGSADVLLGGDTVGSLGPGQSFGEIALLHRVHRTASVRAREPVRVAELTADAIAGVLERAPTIADMLQSV